MRYDLAIIGGGIIGAGVARDAALRGLKVALFEQEDFGSGTTSRSTRLIHGGLRYLSKYDFALVKEALTERRALLQNAPHLVRPLAFLLPMYRGHGHSLPVLWAGILLYDFLDRRRSVPHHRLLPRSELLKLEPSLRTEGLRGGFLYFDSQCKFPERLCLENVLDAQANGAHVQNHARVVGFVVQGGEISKIRIRDDLSGAESEAEADLVINCTGPWLDEVEQMIDRDAPPHLRRTKGVHLVFRRFTERALIFETREHDRVVFAIPWGDYELVGTTDTDYDGRNEDVRTDEEDVDYVLEQLAAVTQHGLRREDILFTTAGLRPLLRQVGRSTADVTRRHQLIDHEENDGIRGYATVVGGKITTFRGIAEEIVDFAVRKLGARRRRCSTADTPLPGGRFEGAWPELRQRVVAAGERLGIGTDISHHLVDRYGATSLDVLDLVRSQPSLGRRIEQERPWVWAEVDHAVKNELAQTLSDVMLRRLAIGLSEGQGRAVATEVALAMAPRFSWDAARVDREVKEYFVALDRNWSVPGRVSP